MRRAVSYARFSTDLQNEKSIEDQEALNRLFAQKNEYELVKFYSDAAQSGASILGREGLLELLADAKERKFDAVIVEELDRLSRDMEDLAGIHKRLSFMNIEIIAVHEGLANTVTVGLRGLVGQLFREDNARKVRRGMQGKIRSGLSAGGKAYGYKPDPLNKGKLLIVPEEADVVRRIFEDVAAGYSPRQIAYHLTAEKAPAPRGKHWNQSAIYGWAERGTGIARNHLYVGKIAWNKIRMVKEPDTGKRLSRSNPPDEWQWVDVPELRIVDDELFDRVQELMKPTTRAPRETGALKRPKRLLSGLLKCACGSGMSTKGKDKTGRERIVCSAHHESRACPCPQTFYLDKVERTVIDVVRKEVANPNRLVTYVKAYNEARKEFAAKMIQRRSTLERRIKALDEELDRLVDFIAKGIGKPERIGEQITAKEAEFKAAKAELSMEPPALDDPVTLHPAALKTYEDQLMELRDAMQERVEGGYPKIGECLRELVASIVVRRGPKDGQVDVEIRGKLRSLLEKPSGPTIGKNSSGGGLVAEEGFKFNNRRELVTFDKRVSG